MPGSLPVEEMQEDIEFLASDEELGRSIWEFLPALFGFAGFVFAWRGEAGFAGLAFFGAVVAIAFTLPKRLENRQANRLRRLVVTGRGVLLEYPTGEKTVSWEDIAGLKTWGDTAGHVSAIGLRLSEGPVLIIRDLPDLRGLRALLAERTQLGEDEGVSRWAAYT